MTGKTRYLANIARRVQTAAPIGRNVLRPPTRVPDVVSPIDDAPPPVADPSLSAAWGDAFAETERDAQTRRRAASARRIPMAEPEEPQSNRAAARPVSLLPPQSAIRPSEANPEGRVPNAERGLQTAPPARPLAQVQHPETPFEREAEPDIPAMAATMPRKNAEQTAAILLPPSALARDAASLPPREVRETADRKAKPSDRSGRQELIPSAAPKPTRSQETSETQERPLPMARLQPPVPVASTAMPRAGMQDKRVSESRRELRIGSIEVEIVAPESARPPASIAVTSAPSRPSQPLGRAFDSTLGMRQG